METFTLEQLREKANMLPLKPGVYLMLDKTGAVIYVGKAKALKTASRAIFAASTCRRLPPWSTMWRTSTSLW